MGFIRTGSARLPSQLSVMGHGQCQSVCIVFTGSLAIAVFLYCLYWAMGNSSLLSLLGHGKWQSVSVVFSGPWAIALSVSVVFTGSWAIALCQSLLSLLGHKQHRCVSPCCLYWAINNTGVSLPVVCTRELRVSVFSKCLARQNPMELFNRYL